MNEIILSEENGQVLVSSREAAEKFEKEHKSVLRDIDNLIYNFDGTKLYREILDVLYYLLEKGTKVEQV